MVRAVMIVEMAGKPDHMVKKALSDHIMILDKVKDAEVHSIKISDPAPVPGGEGLFTCFAEADFEIPSFARLTETMFDFMPSSIEVTDPGKVTMDLAEATALLNNVSGRMHRFDEIAKIAQMKLREQQRQLGLAQRLMLDHGIIDSQGKILKQPKTTTKKKDLKKKSSTKKKTTKKKTSKKK